MKFGLNNYEQRLYFKLKKVQKQFCKVVHLNQWKPSVPDWLRLKGGATARNTSTVALK